MKTEVFGWVVWIAVLWVPAYRGGVLILGWFFWGGGKF